MDRAMINGRYDLDPRGGPGEFRSVSNPDTGAYTAVTLAHLGARQPTREQRDEAGVAADAEAQVLVVWDSELVGDSVVPKVGDIIVDGDGVRWAVRAVKAKLFKTLYHCTCVKAS